MTSRHRRRLWPLVVLLGSASLLLAGQSCQAPAERRTGYTVEAFSRQRQAEAAYVRGISPEKISEAHLALTRRPHPAGSDGAREVAGYIRDVLEGAGLEVEVAEYLAFLSEPVEVTIELLEPHREALSLEEPPDPRDLDTAHPELGGGYVAYSASADVTGPVVYVNHGLPADYAALEALGVDVRGRIVLARYGASHRAVKVYTAERAGAAGVILYSDPANDGALRGDVWPDGMWRADHLLQRGNAKYSWFWHGDPLTPGVAATPAAPFLDPAEAPTLPRIPVAVLSAREARKILVHLGGAAAPADFRGGLPVDYHVGPGPANVRLSVRMEDGRRTIRNVVGRVEGAVEPDRWVILGTHHDAWTFGGIDPGSAAAALLEVARGVAALAQGGRPPARSILFAFWDAEEFGLVGSTEFAEDRERELRERAVAYINSDMYTGGRFVAGGVPSLRDFVVEVAADVPEGDGTLYDAWRADQWSRRPTGSARQAAEGFEVELASLGSGADFVAFQDWVGLPTLSLEFLFEGGWGFGTYHSNYDTRFYLERLVDPGFERAARLAHVLGVTALRLASAPVLPFRYSHYAASIRAFLEAAEGWATLEDGRPVVPVDTRSLQELAAAARDRALLLEERLDGMLEAGRLPGEARRVNDILMRLDQALLDESEPPEVRWYRHVVYGWNIYSLYDGQPLPHLAEAIRVADGAAVAREQERIRLALERMLAGLEEALAAAGP